MRWSYKCCIFSFVISTVLLWACKSTERIQIIIKVSKPPPMQHIQAVLVHSDNLSSENPSLQPLSPFLRFCACEELSWPLSVMQSLSYFPSQDFDTHAPFHTFDGQTNLLQNIPCNVCCGAQTIAFMKRLLRLRSSLRSKRCSTACFVTVCPVTVINTQLILMNATSENKNINFR